MKKTLFIFLMFLMMVAFSATAADVEKAVDPTEWKPSGSGKSTTATFKVTFVGSTKGVLYYDFGFSKVPTSRTSAGLNKGTIDNNAITMVKAKDETYSGNTYNYTATAYAYWYCSFNKANKLQMIVTPSDGCSLTVAYTPYTYSITSSSLDTTGTAGTEKTVTATSEVTVDLATFANAIAVYHGNSKLDFTAAVTKYPENGVIAKITLKLEDNS